MLFGVVVLEAYFVACFFMGDTLLLSIRTLLPEFNNTSFAESLYIFSDNAQRNAFLKPQQSILDVIIYFRDN